MIHGNKQLFDKKLILHAVSVTIIQGTTHSKPLHFLDNCNLMLQKLQITDN